MMPLKRKIVYLSRYFEENVELVANMCVKCYQQEEEVKVTAINRNFANVIKSRRLQSLQKKQKFIVDERNSEEISSDFITQKLDENFEENASVSTYSEEPSSDLHDISSSINTELGKDSSSNLTSASNISLNEIQSNLDENTDSQRTSIGENSSTNNSCNLIDNEEIFDQICEDALSNNKDKITDYDSTSRILKHISRDSETTFKNIIRKSNSVLEYSLQNAEDDVDNIISNNTYSYVEQNNSEIIFNNILNKIKSKQQYKEDRSSDCSEENFNSFQDRQAKPDNISTEKISGTVASQSIFKTLNSKNSRLYDDYSTNVNRSKNYKQKSISSVKYNVNTVQSTGCAGTVNNEDLNGVNNDKRCFSSSQPDEEIVETTNDVSILELINRIHSPVEFLTDNNKINILNEESLIEETQDVRIVEAKHDLEEINRIEENIIEASIKEETCFSQYFSHKSKNISNAPVKHFQCSEKETNVSQFFPSITNNICPAEEKPKRKVNFSKLRKKIR